MKNNIKKKQVGQKQTNPKQMKNKQRSAGNSRRHGYGQNLQAPVANVPADWFYMSDREMTVAAIREALADTAYKVEYWEEAQVLEIALGESGCLDVEVLEPRMGEKETDTFLEKHQVRFLCYITFQPENYEAAKAVMEHICGKVGGFFCGDTEDFTPMIGE